MQCSEGFGHSRSNVVTMHNGLISINNNITGNMNTLHRTLCQALIDAAAAMSGAKLTTPQIPPVPLFSVPLSSTQETLQEPIPPLGQQPAPLPPMQQQQQQSQPSDQRQPVLVPQGVLPRGRSLSPPLPSSPPTSSPLPFSPPSSSPPPSSPPTSPRLSPEPQQPPREGIPAIALPTTDDLVALAEKLAWPRDKPTTSTYTMQKRPRTIEPIWQEWFHGIDGEPSIWQMNKYYKWRKNANAVVRKHYAFNRIIIESVLKAISEAQGSSIELREQAGLLAVRTEIALAGSLNRYFLQLCRR